MSPFLRKAASMIVCLPPAYFPPVMSNGIVSLACHLLIFRFLAIALFWLNVGFSLILWLLFFIRMIFYLQEMLTDMKM